MPDVPHDPIHGILPSLLPFKNTQHAQLRPDDMLGASTSAMITLAIAAHHPAFPGDRLTPLSTRSITVHPPGHPRRQTALSNSTEHRSRTPFRHHYTPIRARFQGKRKGEDARRAHELLLIIQKHEIRDIFPMVAVLTDGVFLPVVP